MNRAMLLYAVAVLAAVSSMVAVVVVPQRQLMALEPVVNDAGQSYPRTIDGREQAGRDVYVSLGCLYCHSQQVRAADYGSDLDRGWGLRQTTARDYLYEQPVLLGTARTGPDLANIGLRQPSDTWHYLHLYDPRRTTPGSIMPPHRFLFERRRILVGPPAHALQRPDDEREPGVVLVPREDAVALVAYLRSLCRDTPVPEVPE